MSNAIPVTAAREDLILQHDVFAPFQDLLVHGTSTRRLGNTLPDLLGKHEMACRQRLSHMVRLLGLPTGRQRPLVTGKLQHGNHVGHLKTRVRYRPGSIIQAGSTDQGISCTYMHTSSGIPTIAICAPPPIDALITRSTSVLLMIRSADCAPVMFFDPRHHAIGIAHAGLLGVLTEIAVHTAQDMHQVFKTRMEDLHVAVGPSIGRCCYDLGQSHLWNSLRRESHFKGHPLPPADTRHFDLRRRLYNQLRRLKIPTSHIEISDVCTACSGRFFSNAATRPEHRHIRERHATLIGLRRR